MKYEIVHKLILHCRVIDVKLQTNRSNGSKFVVAKLGKYDTGEFLRSVIFYHKCEHRYNCFLSEMLNRKRHIIEKVVIRPQNNVYHILKWDDIDRGICTRENLYEVQRDHAGNPIPFNQIVVFVNLDNNTRLTINKVLEEEYIEVNSPMVQGCLNFNNRQYYMQQQEEKRLKEQSDYDQMMSDLYDAYEDRKYSNMDMSEEEKIMSALENGDGELCGF